MWRAIIGFLGGPVVSGLLNAYNAYLKAQTTDTKIAADLAAKQIAAATALKQAEIGHPYEPEKLAFYITLIFYAKCVIWDTILGLGTTPALHGDVSAWAGMIMGFYFGKRTIENAVRIFKR